MNRKKIHFTKKSGILFSVAAAACLSILIGYRTLGKSFINADMTIAFTSKDTSQTLGTSANPYTVVEIVPSDDMAAFGYLIPGQEPVSTDAVSTDYVGDARSAYTALFTSGSTPAATLSDTTMFCFSNDRPATLSSGSYISASNDNAGDGSSGFGEYGYFEYVGSGNGNYSLHASASSSDPYRFYLDESGSYRWTTVGYYYENADGTYLRNDATYTPSGDSIYTDTDISAGDRAFVLKTDDQTTGIFYQFTYADGYSDDNVEFGVYSDPSELSGTQTEGYRYWTDRVEQNWVSYESYQAVNQDLFVQQVLGGSTADGYVTQVITVTPQELCAAPNYQDLIDQADLFVIHDMQDTDPSDGYTDTAEILDGTNGSGTVTRAYFNSQNDLTKNVLTALLKREAGGNPAAMLLDESAMNENASDYRDGSTSAGDPAEYMNELYAIMRLYGAKVYYNLHGLSSDGSSYTLPDTDDDSIKGSMAVSLLTEPSQNSLAKSNFVFSFDGSMRFLSSSFSDDSVIADSDEVHSAFGSTGTASMSPASMLRYIHAESEGINGVTGETYLRHLNILEIEPTDDYIYDASDQSASAYWRSYYLNLIPWFIGTDADIASDLTITTMPTWYFNSDNTELAGTYDLIVIGATSNEKNGGELDSQGFSYNDPYLWSDPTGYTSTYATKGTETYGLAYTAIGDLVDTSIGYAYQNLDENGYWKQFDAGTQWLTPGIINYTEWSNSTGLRGRDWTVRLDTDWLDPLGIFSGRSIISPGGTDASQIGIRYTGTDFTKKKAEQLMEYADAGAVVFDDAVFTNNSSVNTKLIDERSYMYCMAEISLLANTQSSPLKHMMSYQTAQTDQADDLKEAAGSDDCSIVLSEKPTEYTADEREVNNDSENDQKDASGSPVLRYTFTLSGNPNAVYGENLYLDSNGNGVFEGCIDYNKEEEEFTYVDSNKNGYYDTSERAAAVTYNDYTEISTTFTLTDMTGATPVQVTDGNLYAGHTYQLTRRVPDEMVGCIPWKLEIYQKSTDGSPTADAVRSSKTGYTRIAAQDKVKIKVLQLNLTPNMDRQPHNNFPIYNQSTTQGAAFASYMDQVGDYEVSVDFLRNISTDRGYGFFSYDDQKWYRGSFSDGYVYTSSTNWVNISSVDDWTNFLLQYDMILIGAKDKSMLTQNATFLAGFQNYVAAGKSVIMLHDTLADMEMTYSGYLGSSAEAKYVGSSQMIQYLNNTYYYRKLAGQVKKYYTPGSTDYSYTGISAAGSRPEIFMEPQDNSFLIYHFTGTVWEDWRALINHLTRSDILISDDYCHTDEYDGKTATLIMDNNVREFSYYYDTFEPESFREWFVRWWNGSLPYDLNSYNYYSNTRLRWDKLRTTTVESANIGQITSYPFNLNVSGNLNVGTTHAQNFQLDLEHTSAAASANQLANTQQDTIVWYNLTGGSADNDYFYSKRENDSENNFYIYTKGNITYCGLGHSPSITADEYKLFINTIISSYRAPASDPYLDVLNEDAQIDGTRATLYLDETSSSVTNVRVQIQDASLANINRTYHVKIYDANGNLLSGSVSGLTGTGGNYTGDKGSVFSLPVSQADVVNKDEVTYTLVLSSTYTRNGTNVKTPDKTYTIRVLNMPYFTLY